ncbi:MAG: arginine--tRNA ligase [Candidatus Saccharibacteria bacterium]|nr:arginine--tRNA ligase [Candidatus Saccharibacteria bacterium]
MSKYANQISQTVADLYGQTVDAELTRPDPQFGDYSTNIAMRLAGKLGRRPRDVAEEIVAKLIESQLFSEVTIAGPGFINMRVAGKALATDLEAAFNNETPFGNSHDGANKLVLVEYPSTNMAKPFSVGHLRSANQGWAVRNLMLATGWRVITDNHLGDYGSPFGIWVIGFRRFSSEEKLAERGIYELGDIYIQTKQAMKEEEKAGRDDMAREAQKWLLKLEAGDPEAVDYSNRFNQISLDHIHKVMARLGISTDYELGEKFFAPKGKAAVQDLLERGIAKQNADGSVIVPLDDYGIETPMLVLKSNGAALYATNDLATLLYRDQVFHVDRIIYCVGAEQKFYFEQLFAMAKKIGLNMQFDHMWYGMIDQLNEDGTREKMSSRKGVVLLEDLLDKAEERARANTKADDISDEDIKKIAIGAIKFSDFSADRRTGMLFDWNAMFSLTGFSGPYVQYAAVRVNKILRDNTLADAVDTGYDYEAEKAVILKLLDYPNVIKLAADKLEPHRIATYVYELAREMNRYYEQTPVATRDVSAGIKAARLGLLKQVAYVFNHALTILGIEAPERM